MTDPETIEIMAVIHIWLDHWKDILSEPDGPAHASEFIDSMHDLLQRILRIVSDRASGSEGDGRSTIGDWDNDDQV